MANTTPKPSTQGRPRPNKRSQAAPASGPHRMTPVMFDQVRQKIESPGFNNPLLRMLYQELELVTAERDAALARLGEG